MFRRILLSRVRVRKSYTTNRTPGYTYGRLAELAVVPGMCANVAPVPVHTPGHFYMGIPVPRVLYHGRTTLTDVRGRYTNVVPVPRVRTLGFERGIPVSHVVCHGRTELTKVSGTDMNVIHKSQNAGCAYECCTELTEVPSTGKIPG